MTDIADPSPADDIIDHQERVEAVIDERIAAASEDTSPVGVPVVRSFSFAFDTPDLLTGHVIYIPTIDDILLDAWIEVTEAWNGNTETLADVGQFTSASWHAGWFGSSSYYGAINMQVESSSNSDDGMMTPARGSALGVIFLSSSGGGSGGFPGRFATSNPVKIVVSTDGTNAGEDAGATTGAATLYLITVTPV